MFFSVLFKRAQDKASAKVKSQTKAEHFFSSNLCLIFLCSRINASNPNAARHCISESLGGGWRVEHSRGMRTCVLKHKYFTRHQSIINVTWMSSLPERGHKGSPAINKLYIVLK